MPSDFNLQSNRSVGQVGRSVRIEQDREKVGWRLESLRFEVEYCSPGAFTASKMKGPSLKGYRPLPPTRGHRPTGRGRAGGRAVRAARVFGRSVGRSVARSLKSFVFHHVCRVCLYSICSDESDGFLSQLPNSEDEHRRKEDIPQRTESPMISWLTSVGSNGELEMRESSLA